VYVGLPGPVSCFFVLVIMPCWVSLLRCCLSVLWEKSTWVSMVWNFVVYVVLGFVVSGCHRGPFSCLKQDKRDLNHFTPII
jgi:hypothetical protein